jgi:hypothetical protein
MDKRRGLTRTEVVVISAVAFVICIVLLMFSTLSNEYPHPHTPTDYCLSNLKQLSLAWIMYADDNDGKFVNGMAGIDRQKDSVVIEKAWTGKDWADDYRQGGTLDPKKQEEAIKAGALWPYVKNIKAYRCPKSMPENMRTYSIVDSMNGIPQPDNPMGRGPKEVMKKLIIKHRSLLRRPYERIVFIDEGWAAPGSYAVYYDKEKWWDLPSVRHSYMTAVSFADAHSEYWKWKGEETIKLGRSSELTQFRQHVVPKTVEGKEDLQKMQKAVWGELGYTPSKGE